MLHCNTNQSERIFILFLEIPWNVESWNHGINGINNQDFKINDISSFSVDQML